MKKIEKIFHFIENKGITNTAFEQKAGVSNGYLRNISKTNSEISSKMLAKMYEAYPDLESYLSKLEDRRDEAIELLPGEVFKNKAGNTFIDVGHGMYLMVTPLVHEYAYGGYLRGFADPVYIEELPKHSMVVDTLHKGIYRTFVMRGDSMDNGLEDAIKPGDKVTGRLIDKSYWRSRLHIHKFSEFIIHHKTGILTKEIIHHDVENGIITIHSKNPDKELYPDEQIRLEDCRELYNVVEVSKKRKE